MIRKAVEILIISAILLGGAFFLAKMMEKDIAAKNSQAAEMFRSVSEK